MHRMRNAIVVNLLKNIQPIGWMVDDPEICNRVMEVHFFFLQSLFFSHSRLHLSRLCTTVTALLTTFKKTRWLLSAKSDHAILKQANYNTYLQKSGGVATWGEGNIKKNLILQTMFTFVVEKERKESVKSVFQHQSLFHFYTLINRGASSSRLPREALPMRNGTASLEHPSKLPSKIIYFHFIGFRVPSNLKLGAKTAWWFKSNTGRNKDDEATPEIFFPLEWLMASD